MDIRLISNFENSICYPLGTDLIVQLINDDYHIGSFTGKKLYIVNIDTNIRQEILPAFNKFQMADIYDISSKPENVYFISAKEILDNKVTMTLVRYNVESKGYYEVYSFDYDIDELAETAIKIFVVDHNYIFFQLKTKTGTIKNFLYNIEDASKIDIVDPIIAESGIDKIIVLDGNKCAIKLGFSNIEETLDSDNAYEVDDICHEVIGIVNIKQFISDLVLQKENVFIEELDRGNADRTFPYMKYRENSIVYSRVDINNHKEEVVIYECETGVTKIRVNNNLFRVSDLWHTYLINDAPYLVQNTEKGPKLINLNTQKPEWKLGNDYSIKYVKNDIIIVEKHISKGLLRKECDYVLAYKYPDTHNIIFKQKAKYQNSLVTTDDKLIIFSN